MQLESGYRILSVAALAGIACVTACGGVQIRSPIASAAGGPPSSFVQTTSDSRTTRVINVRDGLSKSSAFHAASDLLGQKYSIDVSDPRAGFLMTPWQGTALRDGVPDLRYRTRIIVRFVGDDWRQVSVRADANWQRGDEWDIGYDDKVLDEISSELAARIGKK